MGGAVESIVRKGKKILFFSYFSLSFFCWKSGGWGGAQWYTRKGEKKSVKKIAGWAGWSSGKREDNCFSELAIWPLNRLNIQ